jgi:phospholipase/lecithinase/hemolysin
MKTRLQVVAALVCLAGGSVAARAASFTPSELVVFGDSLSDNGNAYLGTSGVAASGNYAQAVYNGVPVQYFTDGSNTSPATAGPFGNWADQFAGKLGIPDPAPALLGGTNFATGGADTGSNGSYFVQDQVNLFLKSTQGVAPSSALYAFWAGANDIADGKSPVTAADNIASYIQTLSARGAKDFVWLNLPPLGETPKAFALDKVDPTASTNLNLASFAFNMEWQTDLQSLHSLGIDVVGVDVYSLFLDVAAANAAGCATGPADPICFANITSPAQGTTGNPNDYLFWDDQHPTTAGDALIADLALQSLVSAPEPASVGLMACGLGIAVGGLIRKRRG